MGQGPATSARDETALLDGTARRETDAHYR